MKRIFEKYEMGFGKERKVGYFSTSPCMSYNTVFHGKRQIMYFTGIGTQDIEEWSFQMKFMKRALSGFINFI